MAIQLKKNDGDNGENNQKSSVNKDESGYGADNASGNASWSGSGNNSGGNDDIPDFLKSGINDLPAYKDSSVVTTQNVNVASTGEKRGIIFKIIGAVIILIALFGIYKGVFYLVGSGGKDITQYLSMTEDELAEEFKIKFEDNTQMAKAVPQYSKGEVTVRSGGGLNVVYINGKQIGIHSDSRKYKLYNVAINSAEKDAIEDTTYDYENSLVVINDMLGGNSKSYYYYNRKNNDCLVMTVNDNSNRVASLTYYTDFRKITEDLSMDE